MFFTVVQNRMKANSLVPPTMQRNPKIKCLPVALLMVAVFVPGIDICNKEPDIELIKKISPLKKIKIF